MHMQATIINPIKKPVEKFHWLISKHMSLSRLFAPGFPGKFLSCWYVSFSLNRTLFYILIVLSAVSVLVKSNRQGSRRRPVRTTEWQAASMLIQ
jgi:hypothetical protein